MSALDWNAGCELALAVARTLWQVSWQVRTLVDEAIRKGVAKPVKR